MNFLITAVHKGPYLSVQPLEKEIGPERVMYLVEGVSKAERAENRLPFWDWERANSHSGDLEKFLLDFEIGAVIRSTSEEVPQFNVERLASVAGSKVGIPVFVVEDFPGNYWQHPGEELSGLFVEHKCLVQLHGCRGVDRRLIHSTGNPRYDEFAGMDREKLRFQARRNLGLGDEKVVLWAGQPDGDNSYNAITRLLAHFGTPDTVLLFRAHPRDLSYSAGVYDALLEKTPMTVRDVTGAPDVLDLYCASDLIVTQFSSAAVEGSYLGTPALFLLFSDLGKKYLTSFKGYDTLPWSENNAAFLIEEEDEIIDVMAYALFDEKERQRVLSNFQLHFGAAKGSASAIAKRILSLTSGATLELPQDGTK